MWIVSLVLTVMAFFAILFTERYPRGIFAFTAGVLRWTWRVAFYPPLTHWRGYADHRSTTRSSKDAGLSQGVRVWELEQGFRRLAWSTSNDGTAYELIVRYGDVSCTCLGAFNRAGRQRHRTASSGRISRRFAY